VLELLALGCTFLGLGVLILLVLICFMISFRKFVFAAFLDDGEEIMYVAHRHIFVHLRQLFKVFLFGIVIPVLFFLLFPDAMMFWVVWAGVGVVILIYRLFDWYYDSWIFTNLGVVDVEWNGFFDRSATRVDYHMVEGISYSVQGVWATLFNFGDILLERIGSANPVMLKDASRPRKVERKFTHFHTHFMDKRRFSSHDALKDLLSEMLHEHVKEKGFLEK